MESPKKMLWARTEWHHAIVDQLVPNNRGKVWRDTKQGDKRAAMIAVNGVDASE